MVKDRVTREDRFCNGSRTDRPEVIEQVKRERTLKTGPSYEKAKKICRLTDTELEMAKRLRVSPESLMRNLEAYRYESWKDPVPLCTRRMYEERFQKKERKAWIAALKRSEKKAGQYPVIRAAKKLGFTRSESYMAMTLCLTEKDLRILEQKAKKTGIPAALQVRRMYDERTGCGNETGKGDLDA